MRMFNRSLLDHTQTTLTDVEDLLLCLTLKAYMCIML